MQSSEFRTRITGPCWSNAPPVVFAGKTATSGPEWQVSMGPRHDLSFGACTTACLASELLVSMGPSPHQWFLHAKQRVWTRITNLYVSQSSPVVLCMLYSVISPSITCFYKSQLLSVVLCIQNNDLRTKIACLYWSQTKPVIFCMQNSMPSIRIISLYGSQPSSVVFACKTAAFGPE